MDSDRYVPRYKRLEMFRKGFVLPGIRAVDDMDKIHREQGTSDAMYVQQMRVGKLGGTPFFSHWIVQYLIEGKKSEWHDGLFVRTRCDDHEKLGMAARNAVLLFLASFADNKAGFDALSEVLKDITRDVNQIRAEVRKLSPRPAGLDAFATGGDGW